MSPLIGTMTTRARWYLAICSARHLLLGAAALTIPNGFGSAAFVPIVSAAPLHVWAAIFIGAGLVCGAAAARKSERLARLGLTWSATSTLMVAVGLGLAFALSLDPTGVRWTPAAALAAVAGVALTATLARVGRDPFAPTLAGLATTFVTVFLLLELDPATVPTSPTGAVVWAAVALKDFTVQADPLRSPFEELEGLLHGDD